MNRLMFFLSFFAFCLGTAQISLANEDPKIKLNQKMSWFLANRVDPSAKLMGVYAIEGGNGFLKEDGILDEYDFDCATMLHDYLHPADPSVPSGVDLYNCGAIALFTSLDGKHVQGLAFHYNDVYSPRFFMELPMGCNYLDPRDLTAQLFAKETSSGEKTECFVSRSWLSKKFEKSEFFLLMGAARAKYELSDLDQEFVEMTYSFGDLWKNGLEKIRLRRLPGHTMP
jgi:hypothetical protein